MDPKKENTNNPYHISYENYLDTNACTECTGLMYQAAADREEWDAYRDVFDFTAKPPKKKIQNNHNSITDK